MEEASAALAYERAAALRDRLQRLEGLRDQFRRLRFAVEALSFPYHLSGHGGEDRVYLIHRGRVRGEFAAPRSATEQSAIDAAWARITDPTAVHDGTVPAHEIDELQLVSAWFAKHPQQLPEIASTAA